MDEDVAQFMAITGTDNERVARGYLEISGNDQMQAIQLFFESPELAANFTSDTHAASAQSSSNAPRHLTGREDSRGVITIDSDDDDDGDVPMDDDDDGDGNGVAAVARAAQEEDDAAMARRLQEEMYGQGGGAAAEDVRAPMSRTTETLVAPNPAWGMEDDNEAAVLEQLRRRRLPPSTSHRTCMHQLFVHAANVAGQANRQTPSASQSGTSRSPLVWVCHLFPWAPGLEVSRLAVGRNDLLTCSGPPTTSYRICPGKMPEKRARKRRSGSLSMCKTRPTSTAKL